MEKQRLTVNRGDGWPIDQYMAPRYPLGEVFEAVVTPEITEAVEQGYLVVFAESDENSAV